MTTGSRIQEFRKIRGLTQAELADKVGCSKQVISNVERGLSRASADMAASIAVALNVAIDEIIGDTAPDPISLTMDEIHFVQNYRKLLPSEQKLLSEFIASFLDKRKAN